MRKILLFLVLCSCTAHSQENYFFEKKEAINLIEQLNLLYTKNDKKITTLFTNVVQCTYCEVENGYENDYTIKKEKFIQNNLSEIIKLLDEKKIKNSINSLKKLDDNFVLTYQIAKPNRKTGFEGASALITFKKENDSLKIYSIESIP